MKPEYMPVLYDEDGKEIARIVGSETKKEAEAKIAESDIPFHYAKIETIYVRG